MLRKRKLYKRLASIGSKVECVYQAQVNNESIQTFSSESEVKSYLSAYREGNVIFSLKLYRIEVYSL